MKNSATFSVIVPVYNCQDFIAQTIESILMQTYPAFEIIAVNDGSTDNSLQLLEQFAEKITIIDKPNGGVSSARNAGIVKATGDWIAFLDGDDVWMPQKLELTHQAIQANPQSVVVYSEFSPWKANNDGHFPAPENSYRKDLTLECQESRSGWMYHMELLTNWVLTSTAVVKRQTLTRAGLFDQDLMIAEDWDLILRLSRIGPFYKIAHPLTLYRITPDSLTKTVKPKDYANDVIQSAILKYGYASPDGQVVDSQSFRKRAFTRYFDYGLAAYKQKWYSKSRSAMQNAIGYKPTAIKPYFYALVAGLRSLFQSAQN